VRNVFLFIRRHFNFLFFLVLQIIALSFLFRYNKFHEAAFMNVSTEITGRINEKYNGIEYYFQLKKTNESLVRENLRLRQQLKENYEAPDSARRLILDTVTLIGLERGSIDAAQFDEDDVWTATICVAEFRVGAELADTAERRAKRYFRR